VNPFERFPDAITHIVGLRELYINDAYIEYLPANFGRLSALRTLELRENNMMTLPKSMSRLVNLQRLDIGNNDFTELVSSLRFYISGKKHIDLNLVSVAVRL
jgi:Leucine-rich repeat (LRR) protein